MSRRNDDKFGERRTDDDSRFKRSSSDDQNKKRFGSLEDSVRVILADGEIIGIEEFQSDGGWETKSIKPYENWQLTGDTLRYSRERRGKIKIRIYTDTDQDGIYTKMSSRKSKSYSDDSYNEYQSRKDDDCIQFDQLTNGDVTNIREFDDGVWKTKSIDSNEQWTYDGTTLIERETKLGGIEETSYRDPNGDGIFCRISEQCFC